VKISHTEARIEPLFRCICGRVLKAYDLDIHDSTIELTCSQCNRLLLRIKHFVVPEGFAS
jgi:hypothetical protein